MGPLQMAAQVVGTVGTILTLSSYQFKKRNTILALQVIACLCFSVHFVMLDAASGAALNFLGMIRAVVFFFRGRKNWADSLAWVPVFSLVSIGIVVLTWEGWISLLPMIAMILTTFAQYSTSAKNVRLLTLPNSPCWLVYNLFSGSIAGVVTEVLMICSIVIALFRHDFRKKTTEN